LLLRESSGDNRTTYSKKPPLGAFFIALARTRLSHSICPRGGDVGKADGRIFYVIILLA